MEEMKREVELREISEDETCTDADVEVSFDGKKYRVLKESIPDDE
jgi:hypothetical protein